MSSHFNLKKISLDMNVRIIQKKEAFNITAAVYFVFQTEAAAVSFI